MDGNEQRKEKYKMKKSGMENDELEFLLCAAAVVGSIIFFPFSMLKTVRAQRRQHELLIFRQTHF